MSSKEQVLKDALQTIEKQFGKWAIMRMGDNNAVWAINTYHTWSYVMDMVLWWGIPEGRVVEIYGPESSGKTLISLQAIAQVQKRGGTCAFIDAEHALDPAFARLLWVDTDNLLLSQPDYGEQGLQIAQELARTGAVKLIVIDSVAALVPRAEVEGDMGDSFMGLQARMMSQWLRKLTSILAKSWTTCIFINQIRMKIGVMFGNPETTTGGHALKFFSSQRIEVRKGTKITEEKEEIGYEIKVKVAKNKIAPPFKRCLIPVLRGIGYDTTKDIIEAALVLKLITKAGAFYTLGTQKYQGKERLANAIRDDEKVKGELEKKIQTAIKKIRMGEKVLDDDALATLEKVEKKDEKSDEKKTKSLI